VARICVMTTVHSAFDIRIFQKECKSLAAAGHEVLLLAPHDRPATVDGVQIIPIPRRGRRPARMTAGVWDALRAAIRTRAQIYHFHDPELLIAGVVLSAMGKCVIYDVHEDVPRDLLGREYLSSRVKPLVAGLVEQVEDWSCRWFAAVLTATPRIGERFARRHRRVIVLQNFPLLRELIEGPNRAWSERDQAVAYAGWITRERSSVEMVRAIGLVDPQLGARLELAGDYDSPEVRQELTREAGWSRVHEHGLLDRPGMWEMLSHVRAGLVLYHPAPNNTDAQPNKLFEYMAAGLPLIASDFPLWRELIEGTGCGLLVDPLDPRDIAAAVSYVLTHPAEAEAMGQRGREAVSTRYNWASEERKLLALYARLSSVGTARRAARRTVATRAETAPAVGERLAKLN
jgi:glycosyltransferase involved in cell wall biosynthesis